MSGRGNMWVSRTPSGLPLCSTCHKELGFCPHSPLHRGSGSDTKADRTGDLAAPPRATCSAGSTPSSASAWKLPKGDTVPGAIATNESRQSRGRPSLEDYLQQGPKRRRSVALDEEAVARGKSKRRETSTQESKGKGSHPASAAGGKKKGRERGSSTGAERASSRGTRFAQVVPPQGERRASIAITSAGGSVFSCSVTDAEKLLLRFRGFEANNAGKECLSCYQVPNMTINFGCEARREQAAAASAELEQQQAANGSSGASGRPIPSIDCLGVNVPHVMCLDCFCVFVESRVSERKLVTSQDFDGYTVACPMGCADSFIDPACFEEVMSAEFMVKYRRFAAIHLASHMRIVWCPGCHCGVVPSAAVAAAARRPSVVPAPLIQHPRRGSMSYNLWGWLGGPGPVAVREAGVGVGAGAGAGAGRRPSVCIGCPGCQASLCLSCRALHAPGINCSDAATAAEAANNADADGHGWMGEGAGGDGPGRRDSGDRNATTGRRASAWTREDGREAMDLTNNTKRCPSCHVPIFKDGGCNHMKCTMCQHEFCWLHLTKWIEGGECQRGHWSSNPALNSAYNANRLARTRQTCAIS